ncbi:MAG TPA: 5-dehydro-4-deoxy-D-glucuronate isomerase [Phycisphaerales bacterium]|nr:5-dehydro-4-deoxy-D-glucuronate isomerase [Phycisphaerales bacterium]
MEMRYAADPVRFERMNSGEIRADFLIENLFVPGQIRMVYSFIDRVMVGSAVPTAGPLVLKADEEMACEYFAERREIGVINIGSDGIVIVDGEQYSMALKDALYIGRGSKDIRFESVKAKEPAKFYLVSHPAHKSYPTAHAKIKDAEPVELGSDESANKRTIYKYIHPAGIQSCQLVMGCTEMAEGSVWNTMPGHLHKRRSEVYMYFNVGSDSLVFHYMGRPEETRHIAVRDEQAVLSPSWSIHSGAGLKNYSFVWAMGGENQDFSDMQAFSLEQIR